MSNIQKKLQKNIKKTKEYKKKEDPFKKNILTFTKILYTLIVMSIIICFITVITSGDYKLENNEVSFDYSTILAGQTFNRIDEEYYVVFYNFEEQTSLTSTINNITKAKIYKVNLGLGTNKFILSDISNREATTASELKINGVTLIKIKDSKNYDYVEGIDNVNNYLKEL